MLAPEVVEHPLVGVLALGPVPGLGVSVKDDQHATVDRADLLGRRFQQPLPSHQLDDLRDGVATCRDAGVWPVMITGNHPLTAVADRA